MFMKNNSFTCSFTGYRPQKLPFSSKPCDPAFVEFENRITETIISLVNEGCDTFISGMAMGFDMIAAQCVLTVKEIMNNRIIDLVCALPFTEQAKNYPVPWKEKYERILEKCDRAILLSDNYHRSCYMQRNRFMVDNSDIVMTYYNGLPGGTKNTLEYAEKKGRRIINLALPAPDFAVDSRR